MPDNSIVTNPEASFLGVKVAHAVAGFAGGVITLSFIKNLSPFQGISAVFTGFVTAVYLTPLGTNLLNSYTKDPLSEPSELGMAFLLGLTAMNLIPGFLKLSAIWGKAPLSFVRGEAKETSNE